MIRTLVASGILAALLAQPGAAAPESISDRIATAVASRQSKSFRLSVGVWDAKTGETLHETNADAPRRTASVVKIATTAAALLTFGPRHELATEVLVAARPDPSGVVAGDLVVKGGGDVGINNRGGPGTAEAALREMARSVRRAGVQSVKGRLVLDDTAFRGPLRHPGWEWQDGDWDWYKAPVSSILLTDACVELTVLPAAEGAPALLRLDPRTAAVRFVNRVVTAPSRQKKTTIVIGRSDPEGAIAVTGSVPAGSAGYSTEAACVDPAEHFGDVFLRVLREEGVSVAGRAVVQRDAERAAGPRVVSADPAEMIPLARHATSVLETVRIANKHSQNLYAEVLLRALGSVAGDGSFEGGCRIVRNALGFAATDGTFRQVDGSGLARENQATVGAIGKVLARMYASPVATDFIASLAGPAEPESTLRDRFRGAKYEGRLFAKTGTLRDTKSLAGYVRGRSGRTFVFAALCEGDNARARELQDDVVDVLIEQ